MKTSFDGLFREGPSLPRQLELVDRSRVAVVGGGPAGSLFAYFVLKMAETVGTELEIDIFEPRHFTHCGPAGCNHCGGIVSESLVQLLAAEGINLPESVIQRGIDSYMLHMDVGSVRIVTPLREKRIAAVFRGNGPRNSRNIDVESFDLHLQKLAVEKGARLVHRLVSRIDADSTAVRLGFADGSAASYDLAAVGVGINSSLLPGLEASLDGYRAPRKAATYIAEFQLGEDVVQEYLGNSMHVFLVDLPRLEFVALIPKGAVVTLCLLGDDIDQELVDNFLGAPEVRRCLPPDFGPANEVCHCSPMINMGGTARPFGDRLVLVGDSGVTRLYKDGIGAAYRTAKAAAVTVVFQGIAADDFEHHYWPTCQRIARDNTIGKFIFGFNHSLQRFRFSRKAILRMTRREQEADEKIRGHMSQVLWDLFTGSAPYREVLTNSVHPGFVGRLSWNLLLGIFGPTRKDTDGLRTGQSRPGRRSHE